MSIPSRLRSLLFVPGNRADLLAKAPRYQPDAVVLDLEDSVPDDDTPKEAARRIIQGATAAAEPVVPLVVRPRAASTPHLRGDLEAAVGPGLAAILLPQANTPTDVLTAAGILGELEAARGLASESISIIAMPETALGIRNAYESFTASPRVVGAIFAGAEGGDLAQSLGYRSPLQGDEFRYAKTKLQLDARAAGLLHIVDGVFPDLDDTDAFTEDSRQGWHLGYTGRLAVNPRQVKTLNELYLPTEGEIERARAELQALAVAAEHGDGAVRFEGRLLDVGSRRSAEAVLAAAELPVDIPGSETPPPAGERDATEPLAASPERPAPGASPGELASWFSHAANAFLRTRSDQHDELSMLLGLRLIRAANQFIRAQERAALQRHGLRWTRFHVLLIFRVCEVLEASVVAQMLGVSRQAASTVLSTMQRDGLLERAEVSSGDGRTIPLRLTDSGRALLEEVIDEALGEIETWFSRFAPPERAALNELLYVAIATNGDESPVEASAVTPRSEPEPDNCIRGRR